MKIFSIKDNKANSFAVPFFQPTSVQANRIFNTEINRAAADNLLYQHPQDFDLYELGTWDDQSGELHTDNPLLLATGQATRKE